MLRELNREIDFLNGSYIRYTEIYECNAIPMPIISLEKITTIIRKNKMKFHFLKILKISKSSIEETLPLLPFSSLISQIENCQIQISYPRNRNFFLLRLSISTRKENVVRSQVL